MTQMLDGNHAAGALREIFAVDMTTAHGRCASCGTDGALAAVRLYFDAHGMIGRCPACDEPVFRLVRSEGRAWLDLRGLTCLEIVLPSA